MRLNPIGSNQNLIVLVMHIYSGSLGKVYPHLGLVKQEIEQKISALVQCYMFSRTSLLFSNAPLNPMIKI